MRFGDVPLFLAALRRAAEDLDKRRLDRLRMLTGEDQRRAFYARRSEWLKQEAAAFLRIVMELEVPSHWKKRMEQLAPPKDWAPILRDGGFPEEWAEVLNREKVPESWQSLLDRGFDPARPFDWLLDAYQHRYPDRWKRLVGELTGLLIHWTRICALEGRRPPKKGDARIASPETIVDLAAKSDGGVSTAGRTPLAELYDPSCDTVDRWWAAMLVWTYRSVNDQQKGQSLEVIDELWPDVKPRIASVLQQAGLDPKEYAVAMDWASICAPENRDEGNKPRSKSDMAAKHGMAQSTLTNTIRRLAMFMRDLSDPNPVVTIAAIQSRLRSKCKGKRPGLGPEGLRLAESVSAALRDFCDTLEVPRYLVPIARLTELFGDELGELKTATVPTLAGRVAALVHDRRSLAVEFGSEALLDELLKAIGTIEPLLPDPSMALSELRLQYTQRFQKLERNVTTCFHSVKDANTAKWLITTIELLLGAIGRVVVLLKYESER